MSFRVILAHVLTQNAAVEINRLRAKYDPKSAFVIPGHITIAGPYNSLVAPLSYTNSILETLSKYNSFDIRLKGFGSFLPVSNTTFAKVDDWSVLLKLHDDLLTSLNWHETFTYHPHVTITEYLDEQARDNVLKLLEGYDLDVTDKVTRIYLMVKAHTGEWKLLKEFFLKNDYH